MSITQTITALPEAPSRQFPATFDDLADAFVDGLKDMPGELNTWAAEANALALTVNSDASDAKDAADTAVAAANFKGAWDTLTGALNIPASVYHDGLLWLLLSNLADVTASEPGVGAEWSRLPLLPGWQVKSSAFTAGRFAGYLVDAGVSVTLPPDPADQDQIWFAAGGDMTDNPAVLERSGKKIMGLEENMDWDANVPFSLVYNAAAGDWRFA